MDDQQTVNLTWTFCTQDDEESNAPTELSDTKQGENSADECTNVLCVKAERNSNNNTQINLGNAEYPQVIEVSMKNKKQGYPKNPSTFKVGRLRSPRTDIYINFQEVLQSVQWIPSIKDKGDVINISFLRRHPGTSFKNGAGQSRNMGVKKINLSVSKDKRPSILRKRVPFESEMEEIQREVMAVKALKAFQALKITTDSEQSMDYHRVENRENSVCCRPDVIEKFGSLRINERHFKNEHPLINTKVSSDLCKSTIEANTLLQALAIRSDDEKPEISNSAKNNNLLQYSTNCQE